MSWDNHKQTETDEFSVRRWRQRNMWDSIETIRDAGPLYWATQTLDAKNMPATWAQFRLRQEITWHAFIQSEWPTAEKRTRTYLPPGYVRVYAVNYNIRRIRPGLAGLMFAD